MEIMQTVGLTKFVFRQCRSEFSGTKLTLHDLTALPYFAKGKLNRGVWEPGYADFCRIVRLNNMFELTYPIIEIIPENEHLLVSNYHTRHENELPMLVRSFPKECRSGLDCPIADNMDVILYSKEQMEKEGDSTGSDWDIVCVNAEMKVPAPMTPNTMVRNHLGTKFGGSGKEIDWDEYRRSVEFWTKHAIVG